MADSTSAAAIQAGIAEGLKAQLGGKTPDLTAAYIKFWAEVNNVAKNSTNPHHKNEYANLEAVLAATKPAMIANGLALLQVPGEVREGNQAIISMLVHTSGQQWTFRTELPLGEKKTAQAAGSCITYARRYFILALAGIAPVDDDGEAASANAPAQREEAGETDAAFIKRMKAFAPAKGETGKAATKRFSDDFMEDAKRNKATAEAFIARRAELKAG